MTVFEKIIFNDTFVVFVPGEDSYVLQQWKRINIFISLVNACIYDLLGNEVSSLIRMHVITYI